MTIDMRTRQFGRLFSEGREAGAPMSLGERRQRRARLFAETKLQVCARVAISTAIALRRMGVRGALGALDCLVRDRAIGAVGLPDPACARAHPAGLCGAVAGASAETIMEGYARGLHAGSNFGLLTWWSPPSRMTVAPEAFVTPAPVRALLETGGLSVTLDRDFDAVVAACGKRKRLSGRLLHLYAGLHEMGFAHSFEVRDPVGKLVAGGFGLAIGRVYVTLGLWAERPDQAGLGLAIFNRHLVRLGFALHDGLDAPGLGDFGFSPMAREDYFEALIAHSGFSRLGRWQAAPELCGAREPAEALLAAA